MSTREGCVISSAEESTKPKQKRSAQGYSQGAEVEAIRGLEMKKRVDKQQEFLKDG